MRGISWLAEDLLATQEGLCSMELLTYLLTYLITYIWPQRDESAQASNAAAAAIGIFTVIELYFTVSIEVNWS